MAILLPFILRYKTPPKAGSLPTDNSGTRTFPLLVNPTDIEIKKRAQISETRTLAGTVFQPWPNMPDEVHIKGILFGTRSVLDFTTLQGIIDQRPDLKEVTLIYKWSSYKGYVRDMQVNAVADKPRQFNYSFSFVSKEAFSLPKMMLGQLTGYKTELDYLRNQLYGLKNNLKAVPITGVVSLAATAQAFGTSEIGKNAFASVQKIMNKGK